MQQYIHCYPKVEHKVAIMNSGNCSPEAYLGLCGAAQMVDVYKLDS